MAVFGTLIKKAMGGYGTKPVVPTWDNINLANEQQQAVQGNLNNWGQISQLGQKVNAFNADQLQQMLQATVPGYNVAKSNLESQLRGEIPKDVANQVQNQAAARALSGGYGGSGMHGNLVARDFGATSMDITNRAMDMASRWMAMSAGNMWNAASMFITPAQQANVSMMNQENKFNVQWMQNQISAMPDPAKAALGDAFIEEEKQIMEMAGGMMSMAGGMCWVAREVYGDGRWLVFRHWLLNMAPKWFMRLYRKHGEGFARWISDKPTIKNMIRRWMNTKLEIVYATIPNA